jgi:hypothetical protein
MSRNAALSKELPANRLLSPAPSERSYTACTSSVLVGGMLDDLQEATSLQGFFLSL